jgi:hypothetical protein
MCVENHSPTAVPSNCTDVYTQARNPVSALCVERHSPRASPSKCTSSPIQDRNPTHVTSVESHSHNAPLWLCTNAIIQGRDPTSVKSATRVLCPRHCSTHTRGNMIRATSSLYEVVLHSKNSIFVYINIFISEDKIDFLISCQISFTMLVSLFPCSCIF